MRRDKETKRATEGELRSGAGPVPPGVSGIVLLEVGWLGETGPSLGDSRAQGDALPLGQRDTETLDPPGA